MPYKIEKSITYITGNTRFSTLLGTFGVNTPSLALLLARWTDFATWHWTTVTSHNINYKIIIIDEWS